MAQYSLKDRMNEVWDHFRHYPNFLGMFGSGTLVIFGIWLGWLLFGSRSRLLFAAEAEASYFTNVFTEGISVIFTIVVLNRAAQVRERERLKKDLLRQVRSRSSATAVPAIEQLREEGWLTGEDELLQEIELFEAQWKGADLGYANLQHVSLGKANLQGTNLGDANLQGATLGEVNLQGAILAKANLQGTNLWEANLQGADLRSANLQGAYLRSANLQGTDLRSANLQRAILAEANLQGTDLWEANLQGTDLYTSNLQGAKHITMAIFNEATKLLSLVNSNEIIQWHENIDWTPYITGEAYQDNPDNWKEFMGWIEPEEWKKQNNWVDLKEWDWRY